jgi:hypothetical protein
MPSDNIGRLIRTTPEVCRWCGKSHLQIRAIKIMVMVKGVETEEENQFLRCPKCENEEKYIDKKINKHKHREIKEVNDGNSNKKRNTAKKVSNRDFGRRNK